jgi:hypothetical protein
VSVERASDMLEKAVIARFLDIDALAEELQQADLVPLSAREADNNTNKYILDSIIGEATGVVLY